MSTVRSLLLIPSRKCVKSPKVKLCHISKLSFPHTATLGLNLIVNIQPFYLSSMALIADILSYFTEMILVFFRGNLLKLRNQFSNLMLSTIVDAENDLESPCRSPSQAPILGALSSRITRPILPGGAHSVSATTTSSVSQRTMPSSRQSSPSKTSVQQPSSLSELSSSCRTCVSFPPEKSQRDNGPSFILVGNHRLTVSDV